MGNEYKIDNQKRIYLITFAEVKWVDVFTSNELCVIVVDS